MRTTSFGWGGGQSLDVPAAFRHKEVELGLGLAVFMQHASQRQQTPFLDPLTLVEDKEGLFGRILHHDLDREKGNKMG